MSVFGGRGCAGSLLLGDFSRRGKLGATPWLQCAASHCAGFCRRAQTLGLSGFSRRGFQALEHGLKSSGTAAWLLCSMGDLPGSGTEPCLPDWQAESLPLIHQRSPGVFIKENAEFPPPPWMTTRRQETGPHQTPNLLVPSSWASQSPKLRAGSVVSNPPRPWCSATAA